MSTDSKNNEAPVRIVLGTMTFGPKVGSEHSDGSKNPLPFYCQTPPEVALAQLKALINNPRALIQSGPEKGKVLVDTASAYQNGFTEKTLGEIFSSHEEIREKVSIHTKVNSAQLPHKSLSKISVLAQAGESLNSLKVKYIDILYLHSPDINTNIEDTLDGIEVLWKNNQIKEFGLSNYPSWKVVDIWYRCKARNMVLPTVYQGCYNAITRGIEFEATAAFRELGIRSYHYNPLAGGLLTGKYESFESNLKESGRFGAASPISGPMYSARYWHKTLFEALNIIREACEKEKISMSSASLRWLLHHSVLSGNLNDGIIIGASSLQHCEANLNSCNEGPLPASLVAAFDESWCVARKVSSNYFRGYGTLPGNSDTFLKTFQSNVPNSAV